MTSAISYLLRRSAWNRVRRVGADFRRPGPRIAAAAAVAYFILLAWLSPDTHGTPRDHQAAATIGALGMLVLVASAWLLGTGGKLVELSSAERALLLPAPVSPGRVMDVKLIRLQATMLGNALLWTALTSGGQDWATLARRAVAFWVVLTTLQLHRIAAARMRSVVAIHPVIRRIVGLIGIGMVALVPIVLSGAIRESAPDLTDFLGHLAANPIARAVLWPFVVVLRPLTASGTVQWMVQLAPAGALLLLHYLWVRRLGPEVERERDPLTSPSGAPLWPLAPVGSAATAFFWKNVTALVRRPTAGVAGAAIVALLALPLLLQGGGRDAASVFLGLLLLMWAFVLLLVGPQFLRNDLRQDQGLLSLMRTLPVRGQEILLGSAGAAAFALAVGVVVLFLAGALATVGSAAAPLPEQHRLAWFVATLLVIGPVSLAGILLQNAAVILLPAWSRMTARRGTATALGSNLANSALTVLLLGVLLLLPAALAGGTWIVGGGGAVALMLGGGVVATVLGAECWLLARWLGARFELLDGAPRVRG
jgi:ABC-2 type transport system permease protein